MADVSKRPSAAFGTRGAMAGASGRIVDLSRLPLRRGRIPARGDMFRKVEVRIGVAAWVAAMLLVLFWPAIF
jgi:hypothetical protein